MGTLFDVAAISAIALGAAYLGAVLHYYPQDVRISNGPRTVSFPEFRRHVFSGNDPFSMPPREQPKPVSHSRVSGLEAVASPFIAGEYALYLVVRGVITLENRITGR